MIDNENVTEHTNDKTNEIIANLKEQLAKVNEQNRLLIAEKQQANQKAQDAADAAAQQAAERNGDIEALKAAHTKELAKLKAKLDSYDSDLRTIRVDNEISRSLTEHNVRPEMADAVTALLKSRVQYNNGIATVDGAPLADHIKTFLSSDTGAHFRRASDNSGGGATGNTSTNVNAYKGKEFNFTEYSELRKSDPSAADAWAKSAGLSF